MTELLTVLPDPEAGCCCIPHTQDAGGGYTEHTLEYEPACPEHSEHVYDPRTGVWELRATLAEVRRQREALNKVREAWEPYADDDMAPVPWRLQRDMNAALGES